MAPKAKTASSKPLHALLGLLHEVDQARRQLFGRDLDLASLVQAAAVAAAEGEQVSNLRIVNLTGIPRESARRKINSLIQRSIFKRLSRHRFEIDSRFLLRLEKHPERKRLLELTEEFGQRT